MRVQHRSGLHRTPSTLSATRPSWSDVSEPLPAWARRSASPTCITGFAVVKAVLVVPLREEHHPSAPHGSVRMGLRLWAWDCFSCSESPSSCLSLFFERGGSHGESDRTQMNIDDPRNRFSRARCTSQSVLGQAHLVTITPRAAQLCNGLCHEVRTSVYVIIL
ncbi:uncharacterized protein B0I36DRAFT_134381 [Microdochium trichocladiopsis]|uniref:Uncharacterized protein n=1 Tax=Microdochium trichocladiopsis TaxID=1682393 RepID=A0A9P8Y4L5_9PEZI|nr:uncharacterized protein B0I36DRAFT_134381 [Microdochium trichocladiopsis]KAH7029628.1 hypothetical protein B0I36DRAFT_134381 [Microdochium trichocladiopsis]